MRLFFLFLMTLFSNAIRGQYCPEEAFPYPPSPDMDWREDAFYEGVYTTGVNGIEGIDLFSPFYGVGQQYQQNVEFLVEDRDFEPEDGWVLVKKFFGAPNDRVKFPTFILYNRYESKLRIFVWTSDANGFDNAVIKLRFKSLNESAEFVSAALSLSNMPSPVIEGYISLKEYMHTPNVFYTQGGLWLTGDYLMAYDPCSCNFKSTLVVETTLFHTNDITLKLTGEGTINQIIGSDGTATNLTKGFSVEGGIGAAVKKGYAYYKKVNKFPAESKKRLAIVANKKVAGGGENSNQITNLMVNLGYNNTFDDVDITNLIQQAQAGSADHKTLAKAVLPPNVSKLLPDFIKKALPWAGTVLQFLDLFVGGGKASPPVPMLFNTALAFSGTGEITDSQPGPRFVFYLPGSKQEEWTVPVRVPYYKNIMGVINLTEKPVLYRAFEIDEYSSGGDDYFNRFDSYKQAEPIKFAINPAAGLEPKEIQGAYYFDGCYIDDEVSQSANHLGSELNEAGLIPVEDRKWRTPFMPLGCLEDYVVKMHHSEEVTPYSSGATGFYCEGDVTFALKTIFKRTDNPDADEVAIDILFPVEVIPAPYSWEDTPANPYQGINEILTVNNIEDLLNPQSVAWDKIEYDGKLNIKDISSDKLPDLLGLAPTITTVSGMGVEFYMIQDYSELVALPGGEIPISTFFNRAPSCPTVSPVDEIYLGGGNGKIGLCRDLNRYNPVATLTYRNDDSENPIEFPVLEKSELFPNPTLDVTKLRFLNDKERANYSLDLFNPLGQKVKSVYSNLRFNQTQHIDLDISLIGLPAGIYLLVVTEHTDGLQKTFRIIKR